MAADAKEAATVRKMGASIFFPIHEAEDTPSHDPISGSGVKVAGGSY